MGEEIVSGRNEVFVDLVRLGGDEEVDWRECKFFCCFEEKRYFHSIRRRA